MTLVVCWRSRDRLIVAADTRIAELGAIRGVNALTDQGPKIFTTPVVVSDPKRKRSRAHASVGFAYAGGTLIAQSVHAMASICLQNLCGDVGKRGPSLNEISELYRKCAVSYMTEMSGLQGRYPKFDAIIFGYCSQLRDVRAHYLYSSDNDILDMRQEGDAVELGTALAFGSGAQEFRRVLEAHIAAGDPIDPFTNFEIVLRGGAVQTVGGSRQYAQASRDGVLLKPAMVPIPGDAINARVEVLGYEVADFGTVGEYPIAWDVFGPSPDNRFRVV